MRYWGILVAKIAVAAAVLYAVWLGLQALYVPPHYIVLFKQRPFAHDLKWTTMMLGYNLLSCGVLFLIILDQKYRCRECGRRLRMPITSGSHARMLFGPPHTEYICLYGHGTLNVPELNLTGAEPADWTEHGDMWKELSQPAAKGE